MPRRSHKGIAHQCVRLQGLCRHPNTLCSVCSLLPLSLLSCVHAKAPQHWTICGLGDSLFVDSRELCYMGRRRNYLNTISSTNPRVEYIPLIVIVERSSNSFTDTAPNEDRRSTG
ncbi:hypothetical protein BDW22DRAFT_1361934 [Trametopsis cervina]|nr:hypothetical protein BDW22DRAFT_1361934 [Trametopsis cervina]